MSNSCYIPYLHERLKVLGVQSIVKDDENAIGFDLSIKLADGITFGINDIARYGGRQYYEMVGNIIINCPTFDNGIVSRGRRGADFEVAAFSCNKDSEANGRNNGKLFIPEQKLAIGIAELAKGCSLQDFLLKYNIFKTSTTPRYPAHYHDALLPVVEFVSSLPPKFPNDALQKHFASCVMSRSSIVGTKVFSIGQYVFLDYCTTNFPVISQPYVASLTDEKFAEINELIRVIKPIIQQYTLNELDALSADDWITLLGIVTI